MNPNVDYKEVSNLIAKILGGNYAEEEIINICKKDSSIASIYAFGTYSGICSYICLNNRRILPSIN